MTHFDASLNFSIKLLDCNERNPAFLVYIIVILNTFAIVNKISNDTGKLEKKLA